mgnify:FL=1
MRAERAVEKVRERLLRTAKALEDADVPYVVVGGNAVAVWVGSKDEGAIRNTKDVDVLLNRADLGRAAEAMSKVGFDLHEANGVTMFLDRDDPMPSRGVQLLFSGERVKPSDPYPAPEVVKGLRSPEGVDAIELGRLLVLKLNAFRDIDRVHIRDMMHVGLIDQTWIEKIPERLRARLQEILDDPDG